MNDMTINGHVVQSDCIIAGHWGQYAPDQLTDIAESLGWAPRPDDDDPRVCRSYADEAETRGDYDHDWWDRYNWAVEQIERWLDDHAVNCSVDWVDGELFISDHRNPYAVDPSKVPDLFGGYSLFAVMDDGGTLCERCVRDETNPVRDASDGNDIWGSDGWGVVGFDQTGNVEDFLACDHCGRVLVEDES